MKNLEMYQVPAHVLAAIYGGDHAHEDVPVTTLGTVTNDGDI